MSALDRLRDKAQDLTKRAKPLAENLTEKAKPVAKNLRDQAGHLTEKVKDRTKNVAEEFHQGAGRDEPANTSSAAAPPQERPADLPQTASGTTAKPAGPMRDAAENPPPHVP